MVRKTEVAQSNYFPYDSVMPYGTIAMRTFFLLLLVTLSSCGEKTLVDRLSARQSIEIMVALERNGIEAERDEISSGKIPLYQISVAPTDYKQALLVLHEYHLLPDDDSAKTNGQISRSGLVPPLPEAMALEFDRALASEIERLVRAYPEVITATVSVRMKSQSGILAQGAQASPHVRAQIQFVPGQNNSLTVEAVQRVVNQVVPSVSASEIEVVMTPVTVADTGKPKLSKISPFGFRLPEREAKRVRLQLFEVALGVLILGFLLGFLTAWSARRRAGRAGRGVRRETTLIKNSYLVESAIRQAEPRRGARGKGAER